jgi:hypothetical protein
MLFVPLFIIAGFYGRDRQVHTRQHDAVSEAPVISETPHESRESSRCWDPTPRL